MKTLKLWNADNYQTLQDAERDGAVTSLELREETTIDGVRDIVEALGIVHNGDTAHFGACIVIEKIERICVRVV